MANACEPADARALAERRVRARFDLCADAFWYVAVNVGLAAINLATTPHSLWFLWPVAGWGIGLLCHGLSAFGFARGWRERAIAAEAAKIARL